LAECPRWGLSENGYPAPGKYPSSGGSIFIAWLGLIFDRNHKILNYQIKTKPVSSWIGNKKTVYQSRKILMRDFSLIFKNSGADLVGNFIDSLHWGQLLLCILSHGEMLTETPQGVSIKSRRRWKIQKKAPNGLTVRRR